MDGFLRFTPGEYRAIAEAFTSDHLLGGYRAFQRALAAALSAGHPQLATRIARLGLRKARILREYLRGRVTKAAPREEVPALSYQEWRAVSDASAVIWVRDDAPEDFKNALVGEVALSSPALAERLEHLGEREAAALYRGLKSGKRFCI